MSNTRTTIHSGKPATHNTRGSPKDSAETILDMLRHGECEGGHIFRGSSDVSLSAKGLAKMQAVAVNAETQWDLIVSSPLKRCLAFSRSLADERGLELHVDDRLREMHFGDWEGQQVADIWRDHQQQMIAWGENPEQHTIPNGEALADVHARVSAIHRAIISQYRGKKILLVTHGGVIRVILAEILSMPLGAIGTIDVPYACLSRVQYSATAAGRRTRLLGHHFIPADKV